MKLRTNIQEMFKEREMFQQHFFTGVDECSSCHKNSKIFMDIMYIDEF